MLSVGPSNDPADAGQPVTGIDLNCDMGEGMETDKAIFPFISSANIACGYHAGDADTMRRTVELALQHQVAIGAHPSYPDRDHFGRIDLLGDLLKSGSVHQTGLRFHLEDIPAVIFDQLTLLQTICDEFAVRLHHVKPHGALYNRAAKDATVSALICQAIREFDPSLLLYGLSGSQLKNEADRHKLSFISEVFADRTYREDGSLTPRTEPGALIEDPQQAARQVLKMVGEGMVFVRQDNSQQNVHEIPLLAETICLHGDGSHAVQFAHLIYTTLSEKEIVIRAPRPSWSAHGRFLRT